MELCEFHDKIYGKYSGQLYVFEPIWDSFRPIKSVAWDGSKFSENDSLFKTDLFGDDYGYGTIEQKAICRRLMQETELENAPEIKDPIQFWKWTGQTEAKWWKDRAVVFSNQCVPRDTKSWRKYLQYLNVRAKTLRKPFSSRRVTKRLVSK
jgi:hypothetical protein